MNYRRLCAFLLCLLSLTVCAQDEDLVFTIKAAPKLYVEFAGTCLTSFKPDTLIIRGMVRNSWSPTITFDRGTMEVRDSICIVTPYRVLAPGPLSRLFGGTRRGGSGGDSAAMPTLTLINKAPKILAPPGRMDTAVFYYHMNGDTGGPATIRRLFCITPTPDDTDAIYWGDERMYIDRVNYMTKSKLNKMLSKQFTYTTARGDTMAFKHINVRAGALSNSPVKTRGNIFSTAMRDEIKGMGETGMMYITLYMGTYTSSVLSDKTTRLIAIKLPVRDRRERRGGWLKIKTLRS